MDKNIKPETFAKIIKQYLEIYVEDIGEAVKETATQIGKDEVNELKEKSPKKTKRYSKGWSIKTERKIKSYYAVKIHNKTDYQLTHLLEFGHHKRNGTGWVNPSPKKRTH